VEFNARFGDPETQVVLPRMESDLVEVILQVLEGHTPELVWTEEAVVGVVAAAKGYPGKSETGAVIEGLDELSPDVLVFHAGTAKNQHGQFMTTGGRAFLLASRGTTIQAAKDGAYAALRQISCPGIFFRTDIGCRALTGAQCKNFLCERE
jgi:phosphoribosylamine--glycine ligase